MQQVSLFTPTEVQELIDIYLDLVDLDFGLELIAPYIDRMNQSALNRLGKLLLGILQDYVGADILQMQIPELDFEFNDEELNEDVAGDVSSDIALAPSKIGTPSPLKLRQQVMMNMRKRVRNPEMMGKILAKKEIPQKYKDFLNKLLKRISIVGDTNV
jgi:hypothetical protein